jgi:O-antigen/teichoic acid export membrane protein
MQDEPQRIAEAWARVVRMIAAITVPAMAGIMVVAPDFISVALGEQWMEAAPILQVLAWVGILQAIQSLNVDILMARDRTGLMFRFTAVFTTVQIAGFLVGINWGVMGLAVAFAITSTVIEPVLTVITARVIGVSPMIFFRAISGVFQAGAGMVAVLVLVRPALVEAGVPTGARLALLVALGAIVYLPLCAWRAPEVVRDTRSLLPARLTRRFMPVARTAEG